MLENGTRSSQSDYSGGRVAIVGAGPGGLAAGMLLASQGLSVDIYEKQAFIGGRSSRLELGDYRFDRGATFVLMPHVWEELFAAAGRSLTDYVEWHRLDPMYRLQFGELQLHPTTDQDAMAEQIERYFPGEGDNYRRFMRDEEEKFNRLMPLLQRPFRGLRDYVSLDVLRALPKLHATETVYSRLSRYFKDERLKAAFSFQAKYLGMSPWECPGTFTILSFLEHRFGLVHPVGGVNRLFDAMAAVIREHGGRIHTQTPVERVLVEQGRAKGLRLQGGERIQADDVVIGADFAHAAARLFAPGTLRKYTKEKLDQKKYSCSTFMLYLGVNRKVQLPHHTVLFAEDYRRNVEDITQRGVLSEEPSLYVHNPGLLDPTLAPPGKSALYVLVPVPNLSADVSWPEQRERFRSLVLDRLEREPELAGLRDDIEEERIITPQDWQDDLDVYRGAVFNLAHSLDQMLAFRPRNRFEEVQRCWLVGGGTHPGSGLPTIIESAKISCAMLLESRKAAGRRWTGVPVGPLTKRAEL
ncbi:phytoene desaturase family protein [Gorillibacterium sp. sgz5001074]|uniref:phytoene desaturase family protein n=1 Tax=Gorillibacterium sp. sgz5001074 TaxID=3446695 RepID=UPI003F6623AE